MKTSVSLSNPVSVLRTILLDGVALAFIFFVPSLSHLFNIPVYMIEPMRVMLVLSLAHSSRKNSYLLALALPVFSYLVSGHPFFGKMLMITAELTLNVFLFYLFIGQLRNFFVSALISILASKLFVYILYFAFFSFAFVKAESDPVFLGIQLLTALIFSGYLLLSNRKSTNQQ